MYSISGSLEMMIKFPLFFKCKFLLSLSLTIPTQIIEYQENIQLVCINLEISFNSHNIILDFKF
jgi:hypothetical protein